MASYLLKNQILKHLSRFFKNLNPNQLSTSSSTITLHNLELNEDTLKSLFLLSPSSSENETSLIRISSAQCTSLSLQIPWTSITTSPICINFDQLFITIEILETPVSTPQGVEKGSKGLEDEEKSYGFVDKIIDGISFSLNSLHVKLKAPTFTASLDLSFLKANPSPPNFKQFPGKKQDLRLSRVKSAPFILLFRTISWQTLKIEAKARNRNEPESDDDEENYRKGASDVIRLISSGGSAQMTVKKCLLNREVVCVKFNFLMEDILWLLTATSSQSRDAMTLINSISELIVSQSTTGHTSAAASPLPAPNLSVPATKSTASRSPSKSAAAAAVRMDTSSSLYKIFTQFDLFESSIHFNLKTFQLQIVDDMNPSEGSFHSKFPPLSSGSALLFSATGIVLSLFPEYNPRRGFKHEEFDEKDTSLHVRIRVSTMQLHCVGLNDPRLRSRKKTDEEKNKYFISAPVGVPDIIPAIEISLNHFYENDVKKSGTTAGRQGPSDWVRIKLGPAKIYFDEPTLLWIHSFVLPLMTANNSSDIQEPEVPVHVDIQIEMTMPVIVLDQKNPFDIFPSPFSSAKAVPSANPSDSQLEISCTKVLIQQLKENEITWSFRADPVWVDFVKEAVHKKDRRTELVSPFTIKGKVIVFPKTAVSVQEVRLAVDVVQVVKVCASLNDLPVLFNILEKVDIFSDFIAQDKLEMKRCCKGVDDSLFTIHIQLPSLTVALVRVKAEATDNSDGKSDSKSLAHMHRSASAPEDFVPFIEARPHVPQFPLSARDLIGSDFSLNESHRSSIAPDLVSLDSHISDDDDHYILKHIQVPVSVSSSPSLLQVSDFCHPNGSTTPTDSVEEAEDVTAMLGDLEVDAIGANTTIEKEIILTLTVNDLDVDKRATDLHGVTVISTRRSFVLEEPLVGANIKKDDGSSLPPFFLLLSEIKWSDEQGKQELTSILLQNHPAFAIHANTIEAFAGSFTKKPAPLEPPQPLVTPAVYLFLQKFLCSVLHEISHEPLFTLKLDAGLMYKDMLNVLSIQPLGSQARPLHDLEEKHAETFGSSTIVSGFSEFRSSSAIIDGPRQSSVENDVVQQMLTRQEELERKVKELENENAILRQGTAKQQLNHESD